MKIRGVIGFALQAIEELWTVGSMALSLAPASIGMLISMEQPWHVVNRLWVETRGIFWSQYPDFGHRLPVDPQSGGGKGTWSRFMRSLPDCWLS
jgi:hypothetical protein